MKKALELHRQDVEKPEKSPYDVLRKEKREEGVPLRLRGGAPNESKREKVRKAFGLTPKQKGDYSDYEKQYAPTGKSTKEERMAHPGYRVYHDVRAAYELMQRHKYSAEEAVKNYNSWYPEKKTERDGEGSSSGKVAHDFDLNELPREPSRGQGQEPPWSMEIRDDGAPGLP